MYIIVDGVFSLFKKWKVIILFLLMVVLFPIIEDFGILQTEYFLRNIGMSINVKSIIDYILLLTSISIFTFIWISNIQELSNWNYEVLFMRVSSKKIFLYKMISLLTQMIILNLIIYLLAMISNYLVYDQLQIGVILKLYLYDVLVKSIIGVILATLYMKINLYVLVLPMLIFLPVFSNYEVFPSYYLSKGTGEYVDLLMRLLILIIISGFSIYLQDRWKIGFYERGRR